MATDRDWSVPAVAEVLIIGAGPAGLSLGCELKRRGVPFLIVEKGNVGHSWGGMPRNLKLVSPWKTNYLPGTKHSLFPRHYGMNREEFVDYLQTYAQENDLPLQTGVQVRTLRQTEDGLFRVQTADAELTAKVVVNATGYFGNPFVPEFRGAAESAIPQHHVANYRDPPTVRGLIGKERGLVLIVGKRLSAGQTMVELIDAGFDVALSHRSRIQFGAGPWAWWILYRIFPWLEWLKLKVYGENAPANDVRMQGGHARELIESGKVKTFPAIERFENERVIFQRGLSLKPDLVLYATGFHPTLQHLFPLALAIPHERGVPCLRNFESIAIPNLFFLGLDGARNFQSRFLRGIRQDAVLLARILEDRLASNWMQQNRPKLEPRRTGEVNVGASPEFANSRLRERVE